HKLIDGRALAAAAKAEIKQRVAILEELGWSHKLVSLDVAGVDATALYIRNQRRACHDVGITFENRTYAADVTERELLAAIQSLNVDPRVTGIILQRPLPKHLNLNRLQNAIHPDKDVEGMNSANIGDIIYGGSSLGPCTARASVALLKSTGLDLRGLEVVVVGHSEIVGKPIALLLMEELSTVTICHHGTRNLSMHTRRAEALFVAVGKAGLITGEMVKPGAAVIDIGINHVPAPDSTGKDGSRIVGDVDFTSVVEVAGWLTPVPGGVGPMTVAILLSNTVAAVERQRVKYEEAMAGRVE
ncbi:MAG TPA: bifunctional 5,10-methylenetetrahydrofolate dehydrogenase/5,10-methenyltetrahydrofolate cyclohydrolase, partial [Steroidobacteraceae bacterium]|nr:bifunctional 5,10-methylenetetrahydrofolate dehydrogenase/5,10-methenyltetrahydrofolate cyclohydrolase [Steroidobacteraceae bacterium]